MKDPTTPQRKTSAVWALSLSLAATYEIDFSFFSSGYLDVSVHRVGRGHLWIQCTLIRESRDQCLFDNYPWLFAVFHARHRLLMPRHPPCALISLTTNIQNSLPSPALRPATDSNSNLMAATPTGPTLAGKSSSFCNDCSYFRLCLLLMPHGSSRRRA